MTKIILIFLSSFVFSVCLMPIIMKIFKKNQAKQTILGYVEEHKSKNGTLTMGGVVFMVTTLIMSLIFIKFDLDWFVCLVVALFFGVLGFMDQIQAKFGVKSISKNYWTSWYINYICFFCVFQPNGRKHFFAVWFKNF